MNPDLTGRFENWRENDGYRLTLQDHKPRWWGGTQEVWLFGLIESHPLQFVQEDGTVIRPPAMMLTDGMSSPIFSHRWLSPFRFLGAFFHDGGYRDRGLRIRPAGEKYFRFVPMSRWDLDRLLRTMARVDPIRPCGRFKAGSVRLGLILGGWWAWRRKGSVAVKAAVAGALAAVLAGFPVGCVVVRDVPPGSSVTVHQSVLPWRSVVAEGATNISNHVEGGGQPKVAVK